MCQIGICQLTGNKKTIQRNVAVELVLSVVSDITGNVVLLYILFGISFHAYHFTNGL